MFDFKTAYYLPNRKKKWYIEEISFKLPITGIQEFNSLMVRLGLDCLKANVLEFSELVELFDANSIKLAFKIEKNRITFEKSSDKIEVDDVLGLGLFIEVESKSDPQELIDILNFRNLGEEITCGYTNLYLNKNFGLDLNELEKKYFKNPKWNILSTEEDKYDLLNCNEF